MDRKWEWDGDVAKGKRPETRHLCKQNNSTWVRWPLSQIRRRLDDHDRYFALISYMEKEPFHCWMIPFGWFCEEESGGIGLYDSICEQERLHGVKGIEGNIYHDQKKIVFNKNCGLKVLEHDISEFYIRGFDSSNPRGNLDYWL